MWQRFAQVLQQVWLPCCCVQVQRANEQHLKHSRTMIHQPLGGAQGQATDMEITVNEIKKLKKELYDIIAHHSGQTFKKVSADSDRDYWMTSEEAKKYGMVDDILMRAKPKS